jgi:hypothetical protein
LPDIQAAVHAIDRDLPRIARSVISSHLDLREPANRAFLQAPDDREQHQTQWHQWGIITHTRQFLHDFDSEVPRLLKTWDLWQAADAKLRQSIDGASRWQLLQISILLHDIGKFGARTIDRDGFHFAHHEELSGRIIREELDLGRYGLTHAQIDYVAMTAADHFVLALIRKQARGQRAYNTEFVASSQFEESACKVRARHPRDFVEVGVLFLGDSLAKLNPNEGPDRAVSQYAINIEVAHRYLELVLGDGSGATT